MNIRSLIQNIEIADEINIKKKSLFHLRPARDNFSYILESGLAIEKANIENPMDCMIDIIGADELLAPESIIRKSAHDYQFYFTTDGILLKVLLPGFNEMLSFKDDRYLYLVELLSEKLIFHKKIHICKSIHNAEERLLAFLTIINKKLGTAYKTIPLTRSELGCITGLRTETIIRTVKNLEKKGRLFLNSKSEIIRATD